MVGAERKSYVAASDWLELVHNCFHTLLYSLYIYDHDVGFLLIK